MSKKLTIIFLFFIVQGIVFSQNDSINGEKYWHLRHRLITKFIKPGLGTGESIPAARYSIHISWSKKPAGTYKKLEWGDGTIHLGWYLAVLATEMEMLQRSSKTNDTYFKNLVEELYFALSAINRLDDNAEIVWGYAPKDCDTRLDKVDPVLYDSRNRKWLPKPGSNDKPIRNGFCLRMDGNLELLDYFTDATSINTSIVRAWNWSDTLSLKKTGSNAGSFGFFNSDPFSDNFEYRANGYYPSNELSQDQLFFMLMGIVLVTEFVDEDINYNGVPINSMAREIGLRLIGTYHGMEIRNTLHPNRSVCSHGGNSFAFWQSVKKVRTFLKTGKKNQVKDQILLWGKLTCASSYMVNRALYIVISSIANTTPQIDLCRYSLSDGFDWGIYYLLRRAIYNPKVPQHGCTYDLAQVKHELDLCPYNGPHLDEFDPGKNGDYTLEKTKDGKLFRQYSKQEILDSVVPYWHFINRYWLHCMPASAESKRFIISTGEFNGMDYLLLYNLSNIVFGSESFGNNYVRSRDHYFNEEEIIPK